MASITEIADQARRDLLAREAAAFRRMRDAYGLIYQRLQSDLSLLLSDMQAAQARGEAVNLAWLNREQRYRTLIGQTEAEIRHFSTIANQEISAQQRAAVNGADDVARQLTMASLGTIPPGVDIAWNHLPTQSVEALVGHLSDGSPLSALLDELGPQASRDVRRALIQGVGVGLGPREIARGVKGALGGNLVRALRVSRTEVMRAHNEAKHQSYRQNRDLISGWYWVSALSARTCAACWAQHGSFHPLDERMHDHVSGRCTSTPAVRSWAELGFPGIADTRPGIDDGAALFARQPSDVQRAVLGPRKFAAYQDGTLRLEDLAGVRQDRHWGKSLYERSLRDALGGGGPKVPSRPAFTPAKTAKDAEDWARKNLGMKSVDYSKTDVFIANQMNQTLYTLGQRYGIEIEGVHPYTAGRRMLGMSTKRKSADRTLFEVVSTSDIRSGQGRIILTYGEKAASTEAAQAMLRRFNDTGVVKGMDIEGAITHEFGHIYDESRRRGFDTPSGRLQDVITAEIGTDQTRRSVFGMGVREQVGDYMMSSSAELFAEAFRLYHTTGLPASLRFLQSFMDALA